MKPNPHPYMLTRIFHEAFHHPVRDVPCIPTPAERLLRVKLVLEEAAEFARASGFPVEVFLSTAMGINGGRTNVWPIEHVTPTHDQPRFINVVEAADGLADLNVVVNGSALVWGFPQPELDLEVYRSNMSKLGADSRPIQNAEGKIQKGPNYTPPDCRRVLLDHGWRERNHGNQT